MLSDYQKQPRRVRLVRWLRFRPISLIRTAWHVARWGWRHPIGVQQSWGWELPIFRNRREICWYLWTLNASWACFRMGASRPLSDLVDELQSKMNAGEK